MPRVKKTINKKQKHSNMKISLERMFRLRAVPLLFVLIFGSVGGFLLFRSFANPSRIVEQTDSNWTLFAGPLRTCESGDSYTLNTGNGYYGAYQFAEKTWKNLGGVGLPHQAPPSEQDAKAKQLFMNKGTTVEKQWPGCTKIIVNNESKAIIQKYGRVGDKLVYKNGAGGTCKTGNGAPSNGYINSDRLTRGQALKPGQHIRSQNGKYWFVMQGDGNAVLMGNPTACNTFFWYTRTNDATGATKAQQFVFQQQDGNLVVYDKDGKYYYWSSQVLHAKADALVLWDDGNLVLYAQGTAIWDYKKDGRHISSDPNFTSICEGEVLQKGNKGDCVKELQQKLLRKNINIGQVDGIFGDGTRKGVVQHQTNKQLNADGIVNQVTWKSLR